MASWVERLEDGVFQDSRNMGPPWGPVLRVLRYPAALLRGHGAVVVGPSLPMVVSRSIFICLDANAQAEALQLAHGGTIKYLDPEEARLINAREGYGLQRAWEAWKKKAMNQ